MGRPRLEWTPLGLPDDDSRWSVDPRGLVSPAGAAWSLDWWVGADDRWHVPSRESGVRQTLVGLAPVVETRLRVPGGDVVVRHLAAPSPAGSSLLLQVHNDSTRAVAVALALRPFSLAGLGWLGRIQLEGGRLRADGVEVLGTDHGPRRAALCDGTSGDVATVVLANEAGVAVDGEVHGTDGWASAALIWPLARQASLELEVAGWGAGRADPPAPRRSGGAEDVARGWTARVSRVTQLGLPPGGLATAVEVQRRRLLLASAWPPDGEISRSTRGPAGARSAGFARRPAPGRPASDARRAAARPWPVPVWASRRDGALVAAALATSGCREEATSQLDRWLEEQRRGGLLGVDASDTAATLWAIGVWADTGLDEGGLLARAPVAIARAAEVVGRSRSGPPSAVERVWIAAGLDGAARLLVRLDETGAAERVAGWASSARAELVAALASGSHQEKQGPAGPQSGFVATLTVDSDVNIAKKRGRPEPALVGTPAGVTDATVAGLLGVHLGVLAATDPLATAARRAATAWPAATAAGVAPAPDGAVRVGATGQALSPYLSLLLATSAVLAGEDPSPAVEWVLSVAGATWTWPSVVPAPGSSLRAVTGTGVTATGPTATGPPDLGVPVVGLGDDPLVGAAWWALARAVLVDDATANAPGVLALCRWFPPEWVGQGVEVHGLATRLGRVSWALRWHGARPALLWEIEAAGPVRLIAPGLDPSWSATAPRGEALLALR